MKLLIETIVEYYIIGDWKWKDDFEIWGDNSFMDCGKIFLFTDESNAKFISHEEYDFDRNF